MMTEERSLGDGVGVGVSTALARLRSSRLLAVLPDDVISGDVQSVGDQPGRVHPEFLGDLIDFVLRSDARALMRESVRWVAVEHLELAIAVATRVAAEMASRDVGVTRNCIRVAEPGRGGIDSHGLG